MIELSVSLASNGVVKVPGYEQMLRFGYTKNRGVYRLAVTAAGEWEGLIIRAFWHLPGGNDPASSLVKDGLVDVSASVTAQPGNGCVTFEGSDGTRTVTSADLRYRVAANSGTEDGTEPEPGTPAWQQLVDAVHTDATAAEQAKTDAQTAAREAAASAGNAGQSARQAANSLKELGFRLSMDDFGSHYSNLAVLIQYDFDSAKIDRSMVTEITNNRKSRILLDYMTSMINDLGIHCIVEGIETKEQVDILKKTKAEMIQGFYFGKPVPKEKFYEAFLAE